MDIMKYNMEKKNIIPDDEFFIKGYDMGVLRELLELRMNTVNTYQYSPSYIPVSMDAEIETPRPHSAVNNSYAKFWGRIVAGCMYICDDEQSYSFYEKDELSWREISPIRVYGDDKSLGRVYQSIGWMAIRLHIAHTIRKDAISIDGENFTVNALSHLVHADAGTCYVSVHTPDHMNERIKLLKEAFGDAYTSLSMAQAYLLLPERAQKFILMEDSGGSGKTSWMHAFCSTWPGIATMGLDTSAMEGGSFSQGNALVPLIGKEVAFADESRKITEKTFTSLAALSTGAVRTVRYGSGIAEQRGFHVKIVIASNSIDGLDDELDAVSRRKIIIPMTKIHDESWWRGPSPAWSDKASMHDEIFSHESMHALAIDGIHTYDIMCGEFPQAVSKMTYLSPAARDAMADIMDTWSILTPTKGRCLTPLAEWPETESTRIGKRRIRQEVEAVMGVSESRVLVDGERVRALVVDDPEKFHAVCARYGTYPAEPDVLDLMNDSAYERVINILAENVCNPLDLLTMNGLAKAMAGMISRPDNEKIMRDFGIRPCEYKKFGVSLMKSVKSGQIFAVAVK